MVVQRLHQFKGNIPSICCKSPVIQERIVFDRVFSTGELRRELTKEHDVLTSKAMRGVEIVCLVK